MPGFVDGLLSMLGGFKEPTAYTRIGRAPVNFVDKPMDVSGIGAAGGFDPNSGQIQILRKGRSQRQVGNTLTHEDIHNVLEKSGLLYKLDPQTFQQFQDVNPTPYRDNPQANMSEIIAHGLKSDKASDILDLLMQTQGLDEKQTKALTSLKTLQRLFR